jgi:tetratricopeptide (TPR) repeat protein
MISPHSKRLLCVCLSFGLPQFAASTLHAQNPRANQARAAAEQKQVVKRDAYAAFKIGDSVSALAKLSANIDQRRNARNPDLQIADQLAEIGCWFGNEGDLAHATTVVGLAIDRISIGRLHVPTRESAQALALAAQLYDHVLRDPAQARVLYEQVLNLDPTLKIAADRLAHLNAVEARAAEKGAANEMLRQRLFDDKH